MRRWSRVEIQNNQYLQRETLLFYISTKAGDRFDEQRLKDDFRRLWDTGFLDDLILDVRDGPGGKVVLFRVVERKRIQIIDYRGSKALTTTNIEDGLKEKEEGLKIDTFYDVSKARRVEELIKKMLADKGYPFATVKHEAKTIGGAGQQVSFTITDGPKAQIKEIDFVGNEKFSDGELRGQLKKVKPKGFWNLSWMGGKSTWTEEKWSGDREDPGDASRLQDFFLNRGYVMARVGQPKIVYLEDKKAESGKKPKRYMKLEIPVTEGDQYRVGEIKFEGLTVFREEAVRTLFKLHPDDDLQRLEDQEGVRQASGHLRGAGVFPVDGIDASAAGRGEEGRGRDPADGRGQALLRGADPLHGERLDAGQGDPARGVPERRGCVQHGGFEAFDQADQPARVFQADGGGTGPAAERTWGRQAGRDLQGGGAEPEPVHVRRRGVGAGGRVPERQLPDLELPRPRRDLHAGGADGQAQPQLPVRGDRALLPGPPDHRRHRRLPPPPHLSLVRELRRIHPAGPGHRPHLRPARRKVLARLLQLLVPDHRHL